MGAFWILRIALAFAATSLLWIEDRRGGTLAPESVRRWTVWAWMALAVVGVGCYYRFSPRALVQRTDAYDLVHYYLNAKYFPELGYTRLYQACLVADGEGRRQMVNLGAMRNLEDQKVEHGRYIRQIRRHPEVVKQSFSPERWRGFGRDLARFQEDVDLTEVVLDRGYNATPAWHLLGHALASRVPVRHLALLTRLDLLLVAAMFLAIGWAYGRRIVCIALVWFCASYSTSWPGVGWSLLRYDWLAAAVAGTCLLGRGRRFLGGALLGWATLSRIFPGVLLLFLFVRGAHALLLRRELDRHALSIAAGFAVVVAIGLAATWRFSEPGQLQAFRHDLEIQLDNLSVNRMGVGVALAYRGEVSKDQLPPARRRQRFEEARRLAPLGQAMGLVLLALAAFSVRPRGGPRPAREDDDLAQLGFLGFALLVTASFYYGSLRLLGVLLHARHRESSRWDRRGLIALFAIEVWTITWHLTTHFQYGLIATTSVVVTLYAAAACVLRGRAVRRQP